MKTTMFRTCTATLALFAMAGQSWAAGVCSRPEEAMALKTAAMQQEFMVAALYCGDVGMYNRFVISYQKELQDSDTALQVYFLRANAQSGPDDYNAYKTKLANDFSLTGTEQKAQFCEDARAAFDTALNPDKAKLADVVAAVPDARGEDHNDCTDTAANAPRDEPAAPDDHVMRIAAAKPN